MRAIALLFHDVYVKDPAESGFRSDAANRYKLPLADFDAQLAGVASVRTDPPILIGGSTAHGRHAAPWDPPCTDAAPWDSHGRHAAPGDPHGRHAAPGDPPYTDAAPWDSHGRTREGAEPPYLITVDDGGVSYHTLMADRLEARGWRGHCFVSTDLIGTDGFLDAAQIRELDARGHVIGSHSASHPARFSAQPYAQMVAEWTRSRHVLEDLLGHRIDVASVPGGYFSPAVARAACDAGIRTLFTSEPVTAVAPGAGCTLLGRFTIRHGHAADRARRFVAPPPWARAHEWTSWNAKGLVKPLLGPSYIRIADWLHAWRRPVTS